MRCRSADSPSPESLVERNRTAWVMLCATLLFGVMCGPFFARLVYAADDLWAFHLPLRAFYAECLQKGEPFDWSPRLFAGFYLTGDGQVGPYHPLHLLLYRWLPLHAAFDLEVLLSYPLMFAGTYLFLQRNLRERSAAALGSLAFTFSGFNLLHFVHPNAIAIVAHIPWLLWCLDVAWQSKRGSPIAELGIGLLTASQLLLGYPQYVWFSLLAEAAYLSFLASQRGWSWQLAGRWTLAKSLGLLAGGVQLLPTLDALANSQRQLADGAFAATGSLHPANLVQLLAPYLFETRVLGDNTHELGLYCGAVPLMLALWAAANVGKGTPRAPFVRFALIFGGTALLLAFGAYGGLYLIQTKLPIVGKFRMPARYLVLVHFAVAMLAAAGAGELLVRLRDYRRPSAASLAPLGKAALASCFVALLGSQVVPQLRLSDCELIALGPILICLGAVGVKLLAHNKPWAWQALVLLAALDLGGYGLSYAVFGHSRDLAECQREEFVPPLEIGERLATDLAGQQPGALRTGNQLTLTGSPQVDGYAGLEPIRRLDYRSLAALRLSGVRWVQRNDATAGVAGLLPSSPAYSEAPDPLPRARLVSQERISDRPSEDLNGIDVERTAIVERSHDLEEDVGGGATIVEDRPGRIVVRVASPGRQLLVVNERFDRGWTAVVDGQPASVECVYGDFMGCVIDSRSRQVELRFQPVSLRYGRLASIVGLALLLGCFALRSSFASIRSS